MEESVILLDSKSLCMLTDKRKWAKETKKVSTERSYTSFEKEDRVKHSNISTVDKVGVYKDQRGTSEAQAKNSQWGHLPSKVTVGRQRAIHPHLHW